MRLSPFNVFFNFTREKKTIDTPAVILHDHALDTYIAQIPWSPLNV